MSVVMRLHDMTFTARRFEYSDRRGSTRVVIGLSPDGVGCPQNGFQEISGVVWRTVKTTTTDSKCQRPDEHDDTTARTEHPLPKRRSSCPGKTTANLHCNSTQGLAISSGRALYLGHFPAQTPGLCNG